MIKELNFHEDSNKYESEEDVLWKKREDALYDNELEKLIDEVTSEVSVEDKLIDLEEQQLELDFGED